MVLVVVLIAQCYHRALFGQPSCSSSDLSWMRLTYLVAILHYEVLPYALREQVWHHSYHQTGNVCRCFSFNFFHFEMPFGFGWESVKDGKHTFVTFHRRRVRGVGKQLQHLHYFIRRCVGLWRVNQFTSFHRVYLLSPSRSLSSLIKWVGTINSFARNTLPRLLSFGLIPLA